MDSNLRSCLHHGILFIVNHLLDPFRDFDGAVSAPCHDPALDLHIALSREL